MEIAKSLGGASDEDKAALLDASEMVAMDQIMDMFEAMSEWKAEDRVKAVPKMVRAISDLNRTAVGTAKWNAQRQAEVRRAALEEAAERVDEAAKAQGLDEEGVRFWREKVMLGL